MSVPLTLAAEAEKIYFQKIKSAASKTIKSAIQFLMKCNSYFKPGQNGVFLLGPEGTELKLRLSSLFSFFFRVTLKMQDQFELALFKVSRYQSG